MNNSALARILIVEDEVALRNVLVAALSDQGYSVEIAGDGKTAERLLSNKTFDLIITDILMPERDGIEMIMNLRRTKNTPPIIAITGGHMRTQLYLKVAKSLGARRVLSKPFKVAELLEIIREVLSGEQSAA